MTHRGAGRSGLVAALATFMLSGAALADGMPRARATAADPVVARLNFVCQGGLRVQLTRRTKTVQVTVAGQSRVIQLQRDPGGSSSRNTQYTWVLKDGVGTMTDTQSGELALSGCKRVG